MTKFFRLRRQAGLNVAQACAVGQLGEGHRPVLFRAGQRSHTVIAKIPLDQPAKGRPGNSINCADKVSPVYIAVSRRKPRSLETRAIQVDATLFHPKSSRTPGVPGHAFRVNRIAVTTDGSSSSEGGNTFASSRRWGIALPSVLFRPPIPARGAPRSKERASPCAIWFSGESASCWRLAKRSCTGHDRQH
jgi:hypothetical protein